MKAYLLLILVLSLVISLKAQDLINNTVSYFSFNGNAKDLITNKEAEVYGATLTTGYDGQPNSAYHFNGETWNTSISDSIIIPNDGDYTLGEDSTFSISFWLNDFSETTTLLKWGNYELYQFANGYVDFPVKYGTDFWSSSYTNFNNIQWDYFWHHYVITYDKGYWGIYINGDSVTEVFEKEHYELEGFDQDIYLGLFASNSIDEFYFFDKKLSHEEVKLLANNEVVLNNKEFNDHSELSVYPNPCVNTLNINTEENDIIKVIALSNSEGKTLKTIQPKSNEIDVSDLESGLYLLKIETANSSVIKSFIKE